MSRPDRPLAPAERRALDAFAAQWAAEGLDPRRFDAAVGHELEAWLPAQPAAAGDASPGDGIPAGTAARVALGVVAARRPASGRRRHAGWIEPMELARVPSSALVQHLVRRARRMLVRPFRR